jgi:hypothetical protein
MAASPKRTVEIEAELLELAQRVARERGVAVPQLVSEALKHELGEAAQDREEPWWAKDEGEQPPVTCIGMISSGRGDLSARASRDEFEPEPSR